MKKIIRLTESDLERIVKRVLMEQVKREIELQKRGETGPYSKIKLEVTEEKMDRDGTIYIKGKTIQPAPQNMTIWFDCGKYNFCFLDESCLVEGGVKRDGCKEYVNEAYLKELIGRFCNQKKQKNFRM